jgi:hypothetical protein
MAIAMTLSQQNEDWTIEMIAIVAAFHSTQKIVLYDCTWDTYWFTKCYARGPTHKID